VWPEHPARCLYVPTEGGSERLAFSASESDRRRRERGFTGSGTVVVDGVVTTIPLITATYTVNSDCTGTLTSVPAGLTQNFVVKEDGSQVFFVVTAHPAGVATIAGEAVRLSKK
jgi:hypothetical protein